MQVGISFDDVDLINADPGLIKKWRFRPPSVDIRGEAAFDLVYWLSQNNLGVNLGLQVILAERFGSRSTV